MKKNSIIDENIRAIDQRISDLTEELSATSTDDAAYSELVSRISELSEVRIVLQDSVNRSRFRGMDATKLIEVGAGIVSIAMILHYEKFDNIVSKAFGIASKKI